MGSFDRSEAAAKAKVKPKAKAQSSEAPVAPDDREPPMVTFGKYRGKTAAELVEQETQYVVWALTQERPSDCMRRILEWVKEYCHQIENG